MSFPFVLNAITNNGDIRLSNRIHTADKAF